MTTCNTTCGKRREPRSRQHNCAPHTRSASRRCAAGAGRRARDRPSAGAASNAGAECHRPHVRAARAPGSASGGACDTKRNILSAHDPGPSCPDSRSYSINVPSSTLNPCRETPFPPQSRLPSCFMQTDGSPKARRFPSAGFFCSLGAPRARSNKPGNNRTGQRSRQPGRLSRQPAVGGNQRRHTARRRRPAAFDCLNGDAERAACVSRRRAVLLSIPTNQRE